MLTNESSTSTIHIHNVLAMKLELSEKSVFMLFDFHEGLCPMMDMFETSLTPSGVNDQRPTKLLEIGVRLHTYPNTRNGVCLVHLHNAPLWIQCL